MAIRFADNTQMKWLRASLLQSLIGGGEVTPQVLYTALEAYYLNNGVYDAISYYAFENAIWTEAMKGFRNPAHRAVEFYVSKIWAGQLPDALPIIAENQRIVDPIHQVWSWSNWSSKKQLASRWFALFGDLFIKTSVASNSAGVPSRVYLQLLKPYYVTDFEVDERGFLVYIRLDIPQKRRKPDGTYEPYQYTELWDKELNYFAVWEHEHSSSTDISRLGKPMDESEITAFGIDFIPIVHSQFQDIGEDRGLGCFTHALDKIDEANRQATRLHQMLFRYNKPIWAASAGGMDANGRPLPPPRIGRDNDGTSSSDTVAIQDETIFTLPGQASLQPLVPSLNYADALGILNAQMLELEQDLPELAYYRLREMGGDISGRAVRLLLSDAVEKAVEARGNAESALARADQMALTIGIVNGLFADLGTYEAGDFEHTFEERDVIPTSGLEQAEEATAWQGAGVNKTTALRKVGWTDEELAQEEKDKKKIEKENQNNLAANLVNAERMFNAGQNVNQPPGSPQMPLEEEEPAE